MLQNGDDRCAVVLCLSTLFERTALRWAELSRARRGFYEAKDVSLLLASEAD